LLSTIVFLVHQEVTVVMSTIGNAFSLTSTGPYVYQRQGHPANPRGHPAKANGLIHTFFRPSDDLQTYPYLIPSQFFAHHTLKRLMKLIDQLKWTNQFGDEISTLISDLNKVLFHDRIDNQSPSSITYQHAVHGLIYSYEIDGLGHQNLMDDSNIPSLLSLPYLCPDDFPIDHVIYGNTRKFILSTDNPWFFRGQSLEGR
jgi:uncharacterized protein